MIDIERLPSDSFTPRGDLDYVDVAGLHDLYEDLAFLANMILVGPKGIGKSLSVSSYAHKIGCPIITFDCSEDVRRSNLIGMFVLAGTKTPYVLGPLTTAFEVANEVGQCILCLEEVNALTPQCQKLLNSVADFRKRIEVPEAKRVFNLDPDAKLWVVATMNTAVYGGVYALNEDLKSRFDLLPLEYPPTAREKKILKTVMKEECKRLGNTIVDSVLRLAHETRQGELEYALSTRDVVQILRNIDKVGIEKAMWICTGKFDDDDRATIRERITSTFSVRVGGGS